MQGYLEGKRSSCGCEAGMCGRRSGRGSDRKWTKVEEVERDDSAMKVLDEYLDLFLEIHLLKYLRFVVATAMHIASRESTATVDVHIESTCAWPYRSLQHPKPSDEHITGGLSDIASDNPSPFCITQNVVPALTSRQCTLPNS